MEEELRLMGFEESAISNAVRKANGNMEIALEILLSNASEQESESEEEIVELEISQYTFAEAGASACTVIAASVMQFILSHLTLGQHNIIREKEMLSSCIINAVTKLNESNLYNVERTHLAVDEIDASFLNLVSVVGNYYQGLLTDREAFEILFEEAGRRCKSDKYIGIVLTKPPETVAIILPGTSVEDKKFYFFDSHSRPEKGLYGSYLIISTDSLKIVNQLKSIFPALSGTDANNPYSYMYNMFEANFYELN